MQRVHLNQPGKHLQLFGNSKDVVVSCGVVPPALMADQYSCGIYVRFEFIPRIR